MDEHINPKQPKLPRLSDETLDNGTVPLKSLKLGVLQNVKSAYLVQDILIAFTIGGAQEQCCTLNIWKQLSSGAADSTTLLPSFSLQPDIVVSHSLSHCSVYQEGHSIPFMAVTLNQSSLGSQPEDTCVVSLTRELFSYLFGCEETLSQSLVIVYGCQCGLVFGCSLKKIPNSSKTNQQKQICCINQPILSIHALSFSDEFVNNGVLFIGRLGKIILIKSSLSSVSTQEVVVGGPILSSLLIPQHVLLLSTLTSLQLVCLKCHTDNEQSSRNDSSLLITLFEQPLTILHSPYYLISSHKGENYFSILALRPEGQLCAIKLPLDLNALLESEGNVRDELKKILVSIQNSSDVIKQLNTEIATIDDDLAKLNEVCLLFGDHVDESSPNPLNIELSVIYEQLDVLTRQPLLNIKLSLLRERSPLKKGCFLNIGMSPPSYSIPQSSHSSCSLSLEGLCSNKSLDLKLPIPQMFLTHFRLNVLCSLSFCVAAVGHRKSLAVPLITQSLTLFDFIHPLQQNDSSSANVTDQSPVTITISDSLMCDYLKDASHNGPPLSSMLVKLIGTACKRIDITKCLTSVTDCHGNCGCELVCILPDNSLAKFRLMEQTQSDGNEVQYILSIAASTQVHTEELVDVISQVK